MLAIKPEFIVDNKGKKTKVLIGYNEYIEILKMIEDLQDSKLIEQVKDEPEISLDQYKRKRRIV
jgi:hypothetical protein